MQRPGKQSFGAPVRVMSDCWDVVGLGQAMVDFSAMVGDDFLDKLGLVKGSRKVVDQEERGHVLGAVDGHSYKLAAGGSLSNTLVALARLGIATSHNPTINVAMTGSIGGDTLGDFYRYADHPSTSWQSFCSVKTVHRYASKSNSFVSLQRPLSSMSPCSSKSQKIKKLKEGSLKQLSVVLFQPVINNVLFQWLEVPLSLFAEQNCYEQMCTFCHSLL
jgi:hypothetical protein